MFEVDSPTVRPTEIQAGEQVEGTVEFGLSNVGDGEEARVRLDWGADEWVETVPVVGTETG